MTGLGKGLQRLVAALGRVVEDLEITLTPASRVGGKVLDNATRRPITASAAAACLAFKSDWPSQWAASAVIAGSPSGTPVSSVGGSLGEPVKSSEAGLISTTRAPRARASFAIAWLIAPIPPSA